MPVGLGAWRLGCRRTRCVLARALLVRGFNRRGGRRRLGGRGVLCLSLLVGLCGFLLGGVEIGGGEGVDEMRWTKG